MNRNDDTKQPALNSVDSPSAGSTCYWLHEDEDFYSTQCRKVHCFDSDEVRDEFKFCPFCGQKLILSNDKISGDCHGKEIR